MRTLMSTRWRAHFVHSILKQNLKTPLQRIAGTAKRPCRQVTAPGQQDYCSKNKKSHVLLFQPFLLQDTSATIERDGVKLQQRTFIAKKVLKSVMSMKAASLFVIVFS